MGAPVDGADALDGYERLRRRAFGDAVDEPGLVLFIRRGLRAWLEARERQTTVGAKLVTSTCVEQTHEVDPLRDELTQIWATMALSAGQKQVQA